MAIYKPKYFIGIDEAGRGPLAGPLAVAGVLWRVDYDYTKKFSLVRDSKKISERKREDFYRLLNEEKKAGLLSYKVSFIKPKTIDNYGLTIALKRGVFSVLQRLSQNACFSYVFLDGALRAPDKYQQKTIIGGDDIIPIISLASIVAKTERDKKMREYAKKYPEYGFEHHKGYGVRAHYRAIKKCGICPIHRTLFLRKLKIKII